MPKVIQFFHPGSEHGHDKGNRNHKSWSVPPHKRKFMSVIGDCLKKDGSLVTNQNILLWGEWEPDSRVKEFSEYVNNGKLPRYLHYPYIRNELPEPNKNLKSCNKKLKSCNNKKELLNTDPFIFGDNFKYAICRQCEQFNGYRICNLEPGTIIIFGSLYNDKQFNICKSMKVDTVFVVSKNNIDKDEFLTINYNNLSDNNKTYFDVSFRMAFPNDEMIHNTNNKIYTGVKYEEKDKYDGLFSFVPAMENSEKTPKKGFSRIEIDLFNETGNTRTSFMVRDMSTRECIEYWTKLKDNCLFATGCIATRIDMPLRG